MIEGRTYLRAADLIRIVTEAAERAGQSLEDYQVCIEANWRNNDYDLLEQVRVRTGQYGVTLQLLEEDDLEYYNESDLRVDEINL